MVWYRKNRIDWVLCSILLSLFTLGLVTLYSATSFSDEQFHFFFKKQVIGIAINVVIFFLLLFIPYTQIINWGTFLHSIVILLLLFTLLKGATVMGAQRWIMIGGIRFQPSEFAKITLPLCIVNSVAKHGSEKIDIRGWMEIFSIVIATVLLIIKQPDLGSGIIVFVSALLIIFFAGIDKKFIIFGTIIAIIGMPIAWKFLLHDYQKKRIIVYFGGGRKKKERYQLEQSKIAVGSGGFWGKGFLQGTQKNLKFIPECRTDFIFSVFAEEFGFCGVIVLALLYLALFLQGNIIAKHIDDFHAYLLFWGIFLPFIVATFCNIAMVVGLLPTVGIPLPCMSYGLTHTSTTFIAMSIINNLSGHCEK